MRKGEREAPAAARPAPRAKAMQHLALFRYALAADCTLDEARRRAARDRDAASMARLAAKGWKP